jgi:quercetin dioxygenase-like cupin family protein
MKPATFEAALRRRLLERVQASRLHERQFVTLRRDEAPFVPTAPGIRQRMLVRTGVAVSSLVEMCAGAVLPADSDASRIELVLLEGDAQLGELKLVRGDAASAPNDARHALRAGANGARLYLRCTVGGPAADAAGVARFSTLDDAGWDDFAPGVRIRELWNAGERRSVLVRMRAGASVGAHGHALEEECMMLAGEAFIGDTLLRSGEYQLAPQGSRHGEVATDVGAVFFVNGSLDPAAYA